MEQFQVDDTLPNREAGVEITEISESTESIYKEDQNEDLQKVKIEEVKTESDEEKLQDKEKPKRKTLSKKDIETLEKEVNIEELEKEETEILKSKKVLKLKKPQIKNEGPSEEEVEEFEIIQDLPTSAMLLNIPNQQNEIFSINQVTEEAPNKPSNKKANISLDIISPLVEEYNLVQEKEDDHVPQVKPQSRKASISILSVEPYTTTETTTQSKTEEFLDLVQPHSVDAATQIISSEGIIVQEVSLSEAKPTDLKILSPELTSNVEVSLNLQEAKIISEMTANEKEKTSKDYESPDLLQAKSLFIPQKSISILEIQEGVKEDNLEINKPVTMKPKVKIDEIESIQVQEVQAAYKSGKYYPELIVPTEVATTSIIEQKQYVTEELLVSEKEEKHLPDKLPVSFCADTKISVGGEIATISVQPVQDKEDIYHPDRPLESFQATTQVNLLESIKVSSIDLQSHESKLEIEELKKFYADLSLEENISVLTSEETTAEKEISYQEVEKPHEKLAEKIILPLEVGIVTSTFTQDSEGEYLGPTKPMAVIAEASLRPEEHLNISEVQTADYPSEYNERLKYITESGILSVETAEAKYIQETLIHDQENILEDELKPQHQFTHITFDEVKSIEIAQTTLAEKEKDYEIQEFPESHKGKEVLTQPMVSYEIAETHLMDNIGSVIHGTTNEALAQMHRTNLEGVTVKEILPIENVSETIQELLPETKVAEIAISEVDSLGTTEVITTEKETEFNLLSPIIRFNATPNYTTQIAVTQEMVRTESPTEELSPKEILKKNITPFKIPTEALSVMIQQPAEKEDSYQEEIKPNKKTADLVITDARHGATVLEIITSDKEQSKTSEVLKSENVVENLNILGHSVAIKIETLSEESAPEIISDKPTTSLALPRQEAFEELIVTETNVAEMEKRKEQDVSPKSQHADVEVTTSEYATVNESITVLNKVCTANNE